MSKYMEDYNIIDESNRKIFDARLIAVTDSLKNNYNAEIKEDKIIHINGEDYKKLLLDIFNIKYDDKYHKLDIDYLYKYDIVEDICRNEEYINFKHKLNFVEFILTDHGISELYKKLDISIEDKKNAESVFTMEKIDYLCNEIEKKDKIISNLNYKIKSLKDSINDIVTIKNIVIYPVTGEIKVFWKDHTETSVHPSSIDTYNMEKGILYAIAKKFLKVSDYRKIKEKDYNFEKPIE